jgi:hypothetical protein
MDDKRTSKVSIADIFTFFDKRAEGFTDTIGGGWSLADGNLHMYIAHSLISDYMEDDWVGIHTYEVVSADGGKTWTDPVMVRLPRVKNLEKESLCIGLWGPTAAGTELCFGFHQKLDAEEGTVHHDMSLRDYMMLLGRRERGQAEIDLKECPPGTFMGEQFMEGGLQLPSGRLVFTLWGMMERGENWRCGVLLSDDDGKTWRFRTVAYEPDLSIRDKPEIPAGYNEQTLFLTHDGALVSIIRGREKLGRGVPGGGNRDTWFFRAESRDEGETWSKPELTNLPGTGATIGPGLTLPDGSLLIGCRIPYSREFYDLPEKDLYGLNLARSFDDGKTWQPEFIVQRDHEGNPFNNHYCAMNGKFLQLSENEYLYVFGFFGHDFEPKLQRILAVRLRF